MPKTRQLFCETVPLRVVGYVPYSPFCTSVNNNDSQCCGPFFMLLRLRLKILLRIRTNFFRESVLLKSFATNTNAQKQQGIVGQKVDFN
jgi:hypothetical protein